MPTDDVASELLARFKEYGSRVAFIESGRPSTYHDLVGRIAAWTKRLQTDGVSPGESIGFSGGCSVETVALLLALALRKCIVVPLGDTSPESAGARLDLASVSFAYKISGDSLAAVRRPLPTVDGKTIRHPLIETLRGDKEAGLVLFTSGSTGAGKATLLNLGRLLERYRKPRTPFRTLVFLPLDHIGGVNSTLHALADGGSIVVLEERTAISVSRAIEKHKIELLPTTPTFLTMWLMSGAIGLYDFSSLKLITYGTEPMPQSSLAALHQSLPNVTLKQTYGLTELGILPTKSRDSGSLWMKIGGPGVETQVRNGLLWVRTNTAMLGYLDAESQFDDEGWFNTGDAVAVEGEFLRVLGRESELLRVGGIHVHPVDLESILLELPNVREAMVYGRKNPATGTVLAALVNLKKPEEAQTLERRMRDFLRQRLPETQIPAIVETTDASLHNERFKKQRNHGQYA